jgi:mRNA interferase MazF
MWLFSTSPFRLNRDSSVRPNRLFTADSSIVLYKAGHITEAKLDEAIARVISILK